MGPLLKNLNRYLESHEDKIIPCVIYSVGLALFLDTALELAYSVLNYTTYQFMFQWLSPQMIFLRYCVSVIWRCAFILAVTGVCLRLDIFRKTLIALTWLEVASLFWKHPYRSIVNADIYGHTNSSFFSYTFHWPWSSQPYYPFIVIVMLELFIIDLIKAVLILFIFSSPRVRKFFK